MRAFDKATAEDYYSGVLITFGDPRRSIDVVELTAIAAEDLRDSLTRALERLGR